MDVDFFRAGSRDLSSIEVLPRESLTKEQIKCRS
ncbi:MAG: hypothetical protein ACI8UP_003446 [Porticoccaceae bacterium]|jgi:hypothetical protein